MYMLFTSVVTEPGFCNSVGGSGFFEMPPQWRWRISLCSRPTTKPSIKTLLLLVAHSWFNVPATSAYTPHMTVTRSHLLPHTGCLLPSPFNSGNQHRPITEHAGWSTL